MQNIRLLLGFFVVTACSLDHVVVAALDDAGALGSSAGHAGSAVTDAASSAGAGESLGSGGSAASGGSRSAGAAGGISISSGGIVEGAILSNSAGEAGAASEIRCSCLGQESAQVCGSDGITYPKECSDAGPCLPPAIDCWHACPCLDAGDGMDQAIWFPLDCVPTAPCSEGVVCMMFSNVSPDTQTICTTGN